MTMTDENGTAAAAQVSTAKPRPGTRCRTGTVPGYRQRRPPSILTSGPVLPTRRRALKRWWRARPRDCCSGRPSAGCPCGCAYPDGSVLGTGGPDAPVMTMVRPEAFEARIGDNGLIGLGESFMAGDWEASDLAGVLEVFAASVDTLIPTPLQKLRTLYLPRTPRQERNDEQNTRSNISRHYDLSNELFSNFLDTTMSYSSALFPAERRSAGRPCRGKHWRRHSRPRSTGCWTRPACGTGPGAGDRHGLGRAGPAGCRARRHRVQRDALQRAAGPGPGADRRRRLRGPGDRGRCRTTGPWRASSTPLCPLK